jgi:hypothetical protein
MISVVRSSKTALRPAFSIKLTIAVIIECPRETGAINGFSGCPEWLALTIN